MWSKPYGKTGKQISVIGFGGMRFANPDDIESNAEIVRYAYSKGINYFDTAPGYGTSEDIFGAAFKQMNRDEFYVSTKTFADNPGWLRGDLEKSLDRMGLEKIDFYHIWCVMSPETWKKRFDGGAVAEALKAKQEGLISHVAISSHMRGEDLEKMLADSPFEGVTLGYCAINFPYRDKAVEAAGRMGLGVVTMNPLGGGLIPQNAERFDFIRSPEDSSVVAAALRFNISNPAITSALVGFTTKQHIDEAVAAVENFKPYDSSHVSAIRERVIDQMNELCTGCGYCLPCPEGVPIPQMMDVYNMKLLGCKEKELLDRLKMHWSISPEDAKACSLCGDCEENCTQHLPIRERLAEIAKIEDPKKKD